MQGYPDRMRSGPARGGAGGGYVAVPHHEKALASMLQSHMTGDLCLVGPRVSDACIYTYWYTGSLSSSLPRTIEVKMVLRLTFSVLTVWPVTWSSSWL